MKRRWFLRLSAFTLIASAVLAGILVMTVPYTDLEMLRLNIDIYRVPTTVVRLAGITLIGLAWPKLVRASEECGYISLERSVELAALRWRIVTWLFLIELLVGQNLIGALWPVSTGASI